ncbi:MAG: fructose-1,6-bisphosphatase [Candidatus Methanomethylicia archaeon]|nr:fructose-1,6-bisphosphatase [Candidatus Methanomethylicia archaeon]
MVKTTLSVIKADVGSLAGHNVVHPDQIRIAEESLRVAKETGIIKDYRVTNCGDDLELIMTHSRGEDNDEVHKLAWSTFCKAAESAKALGLYAAGQDLLCDAYSGNLKGMGPGFAEMEFEERAGEPVVVFMADKTEPGAFNLPLYRMFADPFSSAGLVIDPNMHGGFSFQVLDVHEGTSVELNTPEESYDLLALIGTTGRYILKSIKRKSDGIIAAKVSITKLSLIAGRYVGKDDPVCIVRAQHGLPAVGEVLEPFAFPHLVAGWMRGSHYGPLMPVAQKNARCTRFDGPPRIIAWGFQVKNSMLTGPADLFDDPAFDMTRAKACEIADYMRRHGPFMPERLGPEEMEYTTLPQVFEKLKGRLKKEE